MVKALPDQPVRAPLHEWQRGVVRKGMEGMVTVAMQHDLWANESAPSGRRIQPDVNIGKVRWRGFWKAGVNGQNLAGECGRAGSDDHGRGAQVECETWCLQSGSKFRGSRLCDGPHSVTQA